MAWIMNGILSCMRNWCLYASLKLKSFHNICITDKNQLLCCTETNFLITAIKIQSAELETNVITSLFIEIKQSSLCNTNSTTSKEINVFPFSISKGCETADSLMCLTFQFLQVKLINSTKSVNLVKENIDIKLKVRNYHTLLYVSLYKKLQVASIWHRNRTATIVNACFFTMCLIRGFLPTQIFSNIHANYFLSVKFSHIARCLSNKHFYWSDYEWLNTWFQ